MTVEFDKADDARARMFDALAEEALRAPKRPPVSADARKAQIREAAAGLFADRGLDGASLADVAGMVGMAPASLGYYYRNRNELIFDVLHAHAAAIEEALEAADPVPGLHEADLRRSVPPLARLEGLALALLDALAARAAAQRVLLAALHTLPEASEETLRHLFRGLIWRIERVLLLAVPRLGRRRALLFPLAASFTAMAAHYVLWFRDDGRLSRADYARLIARMTVAGGKAGYRAQVGKTRGMGARRMPDGALLGAEREKRRSRSPA